jgi:hypothetical protein
MAYEDEADENADGIPEEIDGTVAQRDSGFAVNGARCVREGDFFLSREASLIFPPYFFGLPRFCAER